MTTYNESAITAPTLPFSGIKAFTNEVILVVVAIALPVSAHLLNAPVRYLLPMHWAIILAGLVYGWRAGALAGLVVPSISYLLSGMPLPDVLPSMTAELIAYGFVAGILREKAGFNPFVSVVIALVAGRLSFIVFSLITNSEVVGFMDYFRTALIPGLCAAVCQIILLPFIAKLWIGNNKQRNEIENAH